METNASSRPWWKARRPRAERLRAALRLAACGLTALGLTACGGSAEPPQTAMTPSPTLAALTKSVTIPPEKLEWVDGPAGRLRVTDVGQGGVPVMFIHGLAGNRGAWSAQIEHLRPSRRVLALDLRGHGESDKARDGHYGVEAFVADVDAVVRRAQLRSFVLVGHSMGGTISVAFAGKYPDRVAGLLLADPPGDLSRTPKERMMSLMERLKPETYREHMRGWFGGMLQGATPKVSASVMAGVDATPREVVAGAVLGMMTYSPVEALASYTGPKLTITNERNIESISLHVLEKSLPLQEMRGVSHWLMMDRPDEFNTLMDAFLKQVPLPKAAPPPDPPPTPESPEPSP